MAKCWFCDSTQDLSAFERSYDSAPYLNDDGTPQMICQECRDDMAAWKRRNRETYDHEEALSRIADAREGFND